MSADHYLPPRRTYSLNLMQEADPPRHDVLLASGVNPQGQELVLTSYYLLRNGRPSLPVMGEFHYSRFPHQYWEEELRKVQAGGVSIVATYLFWNHIEEDEGTFDWSGDRDIRSFIEICKSVGLEVILRCGPFAHGECRNGGLPDWLYGRAVAVRSTNEQYLRYVERFFGQIGQQVEGLLFKDGGPVIGLQIENEYMHAGAPWEVDHPSSREFVPAGSDGSAHLQELKRLAQATGLLVPIYSCTAWGGASVPEDDFLPTQAGYAFTPWMLDPLYEQPPTEEFLFLDRRSQPRQEGKITYDTARYPYVYSELGSGIQMTYPHRPVVPPECVQAQAIVALGSGTNWLGYYMYHGGSNPAGKHSYLNEETVPRISYDFQAPVREYGQLNTSYHHLRLLHLFLQTWEDTLAPMAVVLPTYDEPLTPKNTQDLRYAVRHQNGSGFLFLNNYQDHVETKDHDDVQLYLTLPDETLAIPERQRLRLQRNVSAILPFNLHLAGNVLLKYATAQFITRLDEPRQTTYVFFAPEGMQAEFLFASTTYQELRVVSGMDARDHDRDSLVVQPGLNCQIAITALDGSQIQILVLTQDQALTLWKTRAWDEDRLLLGDGLVLGQPDHLDVSWQGAEDLRLACYPALPIHAVSPADLRAEEAEGVFSRYTLTVPERSIPLIIQRLDERRTRITIPAQADLSDIFLRIDYLGDTGSLYLDGLLINDNFASELPWEVGLKRFLTPGQETELILHISPLAREDPRQRYLQKKITACEVATGADWLEVFSIAALPVYHAVLTRRKVDESLEESLKRR